MSAAFLLPTDSIVAYKHNFKELKHTPIKGFKFYQVEFKNRSERNALCDFCDYLNGYRKKEPIYIPPEIPLTIKEIKESFLYDLEYSLEELKNFLCLNQKDFDNYFSFDKQNRNNIVYL